MLRYVSQWHEKRLRCADYVSLLPLPPLLVPLPPARGPRRKALEQHQHILIPGSRFLPKLPLMEIRRVDI